jgi:predicted ATPase with chaperone activity
VEKIGEKLLAEGIITSKELDKALERQRRHGGRLGTNLVALGYLKEHDLKCLFKRTPPAPKSVEETGLEHYFIADLITKHIIFMGGFTLFDVAAATKLPLSVVNQVLETMRREKLVEVKGATSYATDTYTFKATELGQKRGTELMEICRYTGPAPVVLDDYQLMVELQTIKSIEIHEEDVKNAFSHLILKENLLKRIGPAVMSGKAIFVYGPSGNGKTAIAEAIGGLPSDFVYVPYSIVVGGQIISVYDPVNHIPVAPEADPASVDQRWVLVRRPVVMTGGELTMKMLDLDFNHISKYYEASLQMKANNGIFIADDFGRQQTDPQKILNRWIVPLDRQFDFMNLHTGMKFVIPFDMLVVFSTNLNPSKLVDEAFLRRIPYKIKIDPPTWEEYQKIFKMECENHKIEFNQEAFDHLWGNYYERLNIPLNGCHPRDILKQIEVISRYYQQPALFTRQNIDFACKNYFVEN